MSAGRAKTAHRAELSKVVHVLVECFDVRDVDTRLDLIGTLQPALTTNELRDWVVYFEEGILPAICNLVFQEEFCGFTISEILSWKENVTENARNICWLSRMIHLYAECHGKLAKVSYYPELRNIREIVKYPLTRPIDFWDSLHRIREVLLVDQSQITGDDITSIYLIYSNVPQNYNVFARDPRNDLAEMEVALVMLFMWTHSDDATVRSQALKSWLDVLGILATPFSSQWLTFLKRALDGTATVTTIAASMRRDMLSPDPTLLDDIFYSDASICTHIHPHLSPASRDEFDRAVFRLAVAAGHRQLCIGIPAVTERNLAALLLYVRNVLSSPLRHRMPETDVHSALVLYIHAVDYTLSGDATVTDSIGNSLKHCAASLQRRRTGKQSTIPGTLREIRLFSLKYWTDVNSTYHARVFARSGASFKRTWDTVGSIVAELVEESGATPGEGSPFPPMKRCGWAKCLCSVHKPVHSMRLCAGCGTVAYCGPRCQSSDWTTGGHKRICTSKASQ